MTNMQESSVNDGWQKPDGARGGGSEWDGMEGTLKVEDQREVGVGKNMCAQ